MPGHFNQSAGFEGDEQTAIVLLNNFLLRMEFEFACGGSQRPG